MSVQSQTVVAVDLSAGTVADIETWIGAVTAAGIPASTPLALSGSSLSVGVVVNVPTEQPPA